MSTEVCFVVGVDGSRKGLVWRRVLADVQTIHLIEANRDDRRMAGRLDVEVLATSLVAARLGLEAPLDARAYFDLPSDKGYAPVTVVGAAFAHGQLPAHLSAVVPPASRQGVATTLRGYHIALNVWRGILNQVVQVVQGMEARCLRIGFHIGTVGHWCQTIAEDARAFAAAFREFGERLAALGVSLVQRDC